MIVQVNPGILLKYLALNKDQIGKAFILKKNDNNTYDKIMIEELFKNSQCYIDVPIKFNDINNLIKELKKPVEQGQSHTELHDEDSCDTAEIEYEISKDEDTKKSKKRGRTRSIDLGKLYALKHAGWKPQAIADELHSSLSNVSKYYYNEDKYKEELEDVID